MEYIYSQFMTISLPLQLTPKNDVILFCYTLSMIRSIIHDINETKYLFPSFLFRPIDYASLLHEKRSDLRAKGM